MKFVQTCLQCLAGMSHADANIFIGRIKYRLLIEFQRAAFIGLQKSGSDPTATQPCQSGIETITFTNAARGRNRDGSGGVNSLKLQGDIPYSPGVTAAVIPQCDRRTGTGFCHSESVLRIACNSKDLYSDWMSFLHHEIGIAQCMRIRTANR